jgi:mannitol-1-phosphate/altronate dehydrogenase
MQSIEAAWRQTEPAYDRSRLACGVAHLGVGNFVRAHLAVFLHTALQALPL